jgi:hypothetical protein
MLADAKTRTYRNKLVITWFGMKSDRWLSIALLKIQALFIQKLLFLFSSRTWESITVRYVLATLCGSVAYNISRVEFQPSVM